MIQRNKENEFMYAMTYSFVLMIFVSSCYKDFDTVFNIFLFFGKLLEMKIKFDKFS